MDAQQYDEAPARRRRNIIIIAIVCALILAWVIYHERNHPERHAARQFLAALQQGNLDHAYAVWFRDPDWNQHPSKYSNYTFGEFSQDWGPSSEWGRVNSYSVDCSYSTGGGVIVQATINHRTEHAYVWVDKNDKTLHFPPPDVSIQCGNWFGWLTE